MTYNQILRQLAIKENLSEQEIENEMKKALNMAGVNCSVKDFIEATAKELAARTIYSKIV